MDINQIPSEAQESLVKAAAGLAEAAHLAEVATGTSIELQFAKAFAEEAEQFVTRWLAKIEPRRVANGLIATVMSVDSIDSKYPHLEYTRMALASAIELQRVLEEGGTAASE